MHARSSRVSSACRRLCDTYLSRRYEILFYSLLFTLAAGPLHQAFGSHGNIHQLFLAINLIAAVLPIGSRKTRQVILIFLATLFVLRFAMAWFDLQALVPMNLAIWTIVGLLATANALYFALKARVINREHLFAALSAYLLAGIFFGVFYWVIEQTWPQSLSKPGDVAMQGEFSLRLAIYYSFVTLTTLGYGEIVPRTDVARGLVIVEAIVGQLYIAVLIARLISLYVSGQSKGNHPKA